MKNVAFCRKPNRPANEEFAEAPELELKEKKEGNCWCHLHCVGVQIEPAPNLDWESKKTSQFFKVEFAGALEPKLGERRNPTSKLVSILQSPLSPFCF